MKKLILACSVAFSLLLSSTLAHSMDTKEGIIAVVNDDVITQSDIQERVMLYISGNNKPLTPDAKKQVEQQVLSRLIDESLQMQEAKKLGVIVGDDQVKEGFAEISKQNGMSADDFRKRLSAAGVRVDSLYAQIKSDIAWAQVVRRKLRPQINISETEIDSVFDQMERGNGKTEYRLAEIFLNVPNPTKENDVKAEAQKLVKQITEGASFSTVAREFSQAAGASTGGDVGWIQQAQVDPELDKVLSNMKTGQISDPVRTAKGYYILFLRDMRKSGDILNETAQQAPAPAPDAAAQGPMIHLKQIMIPIAKKDTNPVINAKMMRLQSLKNEIKSCADMDKRLQDFKGTGTGDLGKGLQNALPPPMRTFVEKLKIGELSQPIRSPEGGLVLMVCERTMPSAEKPAPVTAEKEQPKIAPNKSDELSREQVASKLGLQRLEQMAERYLRDLRATAFIDKRL
jgi:peptidyl-prolyl cis-trans isomerase SurA